MGTVVELMVFGPDTPQSRDGMARAFEEMERLEAKLSEWRADSEVSKINRLAGAGEAVPISESTWVVLSRGKEIHRQSGGAFALTWAALASLWNFTPGQEVSVPQAARVQTRLLQVDDEQLELLPASFKDRDIYAGTARLMQPGMAVGLGGIAKGFIVDRMLALLKKAGLDNALVFGGGDIAVSGRKGEQSWLVGIQDPRGEGFFATLALHNEAIATSGDYEHFFEVDGVRYHHILDPRTGYPSRGCRSVTVVTPLAMNADAMATAVFVMGPERGMAWVEERSEVQVIIVDQHNQIAVSSGLVGRLRIHQQPTP